MEYPGYQPTRPNDVKNIPPEQLGERKGHTMNLRRLELDESVKDLTREDWNNLIYYLEYLEDEVTSLWEAIYDN